MYCASCGAQVPEGAAFCGTCGRPIAAYATAVPATSIAANQPAISPSVTLSHSYAGFWLRFAAALIDGILLLMVFGILFAIRTEFYGFPTIVTRRPGLWMYGPVMLPFRLGGTIVSWLYWALLESSVWQATLGKKAMGLYVTDLAGRRVSFGRATGRYFGKIISGMILMIGYLMAGFTSKKQALHDMMAGCLVMKKA